MGFTSPQCGAGGEGMRQKIDLLSLPADRLAELLQEWGEPAWRAAQLFDWLHAKQAQSFGEMTNLPAALRAALAEKSEINSPKVKKRLVSTIDGTVKYLYGLSDGQTVESVLMRHRHGNSLCISTQVGCRMGCGFCASTLGGLERNLRAGEMLGQVYAAGRDSGRRIGSVVLMGIGEPLDNLDNVLDFLSILSSPQGMGMSLRHVSLSTCGLADAIRELAGHRLPLTLSVSLHAPDDALRDRLMPVNRRYNLRSLLDACRYYFETTGRRVSFEYALIDSVNDTQRHARALADLLAGMNCHVNLIAHNAVAEREYRRSGPDTVRRFQDILAQRGINATLRRELGTDIRAACGQLRRGQRAAPGAEGD